MRAGRFGLVGEGAEAVGEARSGSGTEDDGCDHQEYVSYVDDSGTLCLMFNAGDSSCI